MAAANPIGTEALGGALPKTTATHMSFSGTIVHIRADDPVKPTMVVVYIDPDPGNWTGPTVRPVGCTCDHAHVAIDAAKIVAVDDPHGCR